jgi:hypothetical protein
MSTATPVYSVRDVVSPYGRLRDSIPIPGDVIKEMAASIDKLKTSFAPLILMGPPTSLTFLVDEGRGYYPSQTVQVTNTGVFGSLLGVTLTTSAAYVKVTPGMVGNLGFNESGVFEVSVTSKDLLATSSPYSATVAVQDPNALNTPVLYPITVTVRPKATISLNSGPLTFNVVKPLSGPFPSIATQNIEVTNIGPSGSVLDFTVQKLTGLSDWLVGILPSSGSLGATQTSDVVLTVVPPDTMLAGTYTETLRVSGYSSNSYADIQIQLVIT